MFRRGGRIVTPPQLSRRGCRAQANVKEGRFGVDYFGGFDIVLNGLDNMEARRHVNRLCIAAGTPLIESGTAGFLGQVRAGWEGLDGFPCAGMHWVRNGRPFTGRRQLAGVGLGRGG